MSTDVFGLVESYCLELHQVLDQLSTAAVQGIAQEILAAYGRAGQIFVFGNGGSAATASHMACDLGKNTAVHGAPRLCVHSLVDNTALLTALANDLGYEAIFSEQLLQAPLQATDLVIAISGSGNSPNVLAGVATARAVGARTVAITGFDGGRLAPAVDVALVVASGCMEIVEDVHLVINHAITTAVRAALRERVVAERMVTAA
jgi:D-sedoheptulose 7-phosphate isomerase